MSGEVINIGHLKGLSEKDIPSLRQQFGKNIFTHQGQRRFWHILGDILREPMFLLLVFSCAIYFFMGHYNEGFMMLAAMLIVSAISVYQDARGTKALNALIQFTEPKVIVVRDGKEITIPVEELVPGDVFILEEGNKVPADAIVLQENDLTVNESAITGESFPVEKHETNGNNVLYQGTLINSGTCIAQVTSTGNLTVLGKLGKAVSEHKPPKTLLQQQIRKPVKRLTLFGLTAFALIWLMNYLSTGLWAESLLAGLTLAMAAIPEEIPVAFSSFMALGAYHMSKLGIISRQPQTIENLGAVSMICLDKTGTITENKMEVISIYDYRKDSLIHLDDQTAASEYAVLYYGMLASETRPFDSMEIAIHQAFQKYNSDKSAASLQMTNEYQLSGTPPMMTHVYKGASNRIVAGKGAVEKILSICSIDAERTIAIKEYLKSMTEKGYRVIAVASADPFTGDLPKDQEMFEWRFEGLLALYDPPKKNIPDVFHQFTDAGIKIKLLSGDYPATVINIARKVGLEVIEPCITGDEVMRMDELSLKQAVKEKNIFARMFPDAKLKAIEALKSTGEIVAMTGDGVNDGPALKSADVGIAMGKKGTEIARRAADLVLTDDNLERVVEAIRQGRKIYINLKKAVRYIISIHIPIILTSSIPLLLGWKYPNIFTPIHVIFLELIMGPTCSIFFEREPAEKNSMLAPPRERNKGFFTNQELTISFIQGLMITAGLLVLFYIYMKQGYSLEKTRAMVFTTLLIANVFLTFANRSFEENILKTFRYKNNLAPWIVVSAVCLLCVIHFIPFVRNIFGFSPIFGVEWLTCLMTAFVSIFWIELYKSGLRNINLFVRKSRLDIHRN